jgi:NAD(P)-dependent dehydrogenase (short-subunit alcohol dehydrogenase family)
MTHPGLFDLTGKFALVTGGTRGIGLMIARGFIHAGAEVVISSRDAEAGERAAAELLAIADEGQRVITIPANLADEAECGRLAEAVGEHTDRLDVLVNNAGATWGAPMDEFPSAAWTKVLDLNVTAPFLLTRACLPLLRAAAGADDPARVINIGSIDGLRVPSLPNYSYSASKAAIHQLTRVLAIELSQDHITVNAVAPGPFESKMMAATLREHGDEIAAAAPLGRIGRPDDMAGVTTFLASRAGAYVTGTVIPVDGGISIPR